MSHSVKLLKKLHFSGNSQWVICPPGRCLDIVEEDDGGWWVEPEDGEGHFYVEKHLGVVATPNDLLNEPDYNDYESYIHD